jgi:hypothetical protein
MPNAVIMKILIANNLFLFHSGSRSTVTFDISLHLLLLFSVSLYCFTVRFELAGTFERSSITQLLCFHYSAFVRRTQTRYISPKRALQRLIIASYSLLFSEQVRPRSTLIDLSSVAAFQSQCHPFRLETP